MSNSTPVGSSDQSTGGESETTQKAAPTGTSAVNESSRPASALPGSNSSSGFPSQVAGASSPDGSALRQPDRPIANETHSGLITAPPAPAPTKSSISSTTPSSSLASTSSVTVAAGSATRKDDLGSSNQSATTSTHVAASMQSKSAGDVVGKSREVGSTAPVLQQPNHVKSNSNLSSDDNVNRQASLVGKDPPILSSEASSAQPDSVVPASVVAPKTQPSPSHHDVTANSGGSRALQMAPTIHEQSESSEADARGPEQEMKKRTNSISSTAAVTSVATELSSVVEPVSASIGPNGSNVVSLTGPSVPPDMVSLGSVTSNFENSTIATVGTMNADFKFQQLPPLPPATNGPQNQQAQMQQQGVPQSQGGIPVGQQILRTSATNEDSASGSQQAVPQSGSFEIPGVVTLTAVEALDESSLPNSSQSQLPQHASEQVNTIGSVPIVMKIQGESMVVKKKKGRFNILQEAPSVRKPGSSAGSGSIPGQALQIGAANAPQAGSPASSLHGQLPTNQPELGSVHSNTNSSATAPVATGVQSSSPGTSLTGSMAQSSQAGDTAASPAVKKMGRFVVTKVEGSARNPKPAAQQSGQSQQSDTPNQQQQQQQGRLPPSDKVENDQKQQQAAQPQPQPQENPQRQQIPQNLHQQQSHHQLQLQEMQRRQQELQQQQQQQEIQKLRQIQHQQQELHHRQQSQQQLEEVQKLQQIHHQQQQELQQLQQIQQQEFQRKLQIHQPQHLQNPSGQQQPNINLEMKPANWAQTTYVVNQQGPIPAETMNDQIQQPTPPQQHLAQSQRGPQDGPAGVLPPGVPPNLQLPQTPPQHPGVGVPTGAEMDKTSNTAVQQTSATPVTPVPAGPTTGSSGPAQTGLPPRPTASQPAELPKSEATSRQKIANRTPQAFDSKGMSNAGLGKVFYFLDQMQLEVSDADRTIKNLQTDMKILRDKNKELEAKNRDATEKIREERALREAAEAKVRDLMRRMKEMKIESETKKVSVAVNDDATRSKSNAVPSSSAVLNSGTGLALEQPKKEGSSPPASASTDAQSRKQPGEALRRTSGTQGTKSVKSTVTSNSSDMASPNRIPGQSAPATTDQPVPMLARSTSTPGNHADQATPSTRVAGQSMPAVSVGNAAKRHSKTVQSVSAVSTSTERSSTAGARGPNVSKPPLSAVESSATPGHRRQRSASASLVSAAPPKSKPVPMMNIPSRIDAGLTQEGFISSGQGAVASTTRNGDDKSTSGNSRTNSFGQDIEGQNSSSPGREAAQTPGAPQNDVSRNNQSHVRDGSGESFKLSGTRVPSASDFDPLRPALVAPGGIPGDAPHFVSVPASVSLPQSSVAPVEQSGMYGTIPPSDMNQNPQALRAGLGMAPAVGNASVVEVQPPTMVQAQPTQMMDPGVGPVGFQQQMAFNGMGDYEQPQVMSNGYQGLQQQTMTMVPQPQHQQHQQQQAQMMGQQLAGATQMHGSMHQMQVGVQQISPSFPVGFVQVPQGVPMMQNGVQQPQNMVMQNGVHQAPNMGMQNAPNMVMQNGIHQAPNMGMQNAAQQASNMMWNGQPGGSGQWVKQPQVVQQQQPPDLVGDNGSVHQRKSSFDPNGGEQEADPFDDFLTLRSKK